MKILVCGGRNYDRRDAVFAELDRLHAERPITALIEGGASGVDRLAYAWATQNEMHHQCFPADWSKHGRGAGPIRNAQMLRDGNPDLVVAFPGGAGTAHMVATARKAGVPVVEVALATAAPIRPQTAPMAMSQSAHTDHS